MTVTETRAAYEAAIIEAMHTQAAPVAPEPPDLEYTPISAPLPQMVRREELDAAKADLAVCAEVLRSAADVLRACDCPVTATIVDEHAAHIAARWEVQS